MFGCLGPRTRRPRRPRHRYSNFGVGSLGHLLAAASEGTYARLVEEQLLRPLGMASTGVGSCRGSNQVVPGFRKERPTPPWTMGALQGAGAVRSTMADMVTFANATIYPPSGPIGEALTLAATPVYPARGPRGGQGLGWMIRTWPGRRGSSAIWHKRGTYGGSSFLAIDLAARFAVIALGNTGPRMVPPLDGPSWKLFDSLHD